MEIVIERPKKLKNLCFDPDTVFSDLCAMGDRIVFPIASLSFFQLKILLKMLGNFC